MKFVHDLGVRQAVLPPLRRPNLDLLRRLGFAGSDSQMIERAWAESPILVAACFSASNMWTANAATVSPSADSADEKVHLTPANLTSGLHRSIEATETGAVLRKIFCGSCFQVHEPLPGNQALADEGAANHTRLCASHDQPGVQLFVYGRSALDKSVLSPTRFPARQTLEASQAVARLHQVDDSRRIMAQQTPQAIDAGVFHNDVISVGNENMLMLHEHSFVDRQWVMNQLEHFASESGWELFSICFTEKELPLADAVKSYLFNSQLLSREDGGMTLVCPLDARQLATSYACTQRLLAEDNPVDKVEFLDLRQSMNNGGGPACLRLRVVLTDDERSSIHPGVVFNDSLFERLTDWVNKNYRDELAPDDLRDPQLIDEVNEAFSQLASLLNLRSELFGL